MGDVKQLAIVGHRGLVPTKLGLVHYASNDVNANARADSAVLPIVGFHMSPRSVDEYKEIMDGFACKETTSVDKPRLFIAMDEFGYGQSDNPNQSCTLDDIADCFLEVLDRLKVRRCIVAGSLMGCYIALSLAARHPDRIAGVVCANLYYFQAAQREKAASEDVERDHSNSGSIPDTFGLREDGSHISKIWGKRSGWLSPQLNTRATWDDLNYLVKRGERYARGIRIQDGAAFPLRATCTKVNCPVLCINGAGAFGFFDSIGMEMTKQFDEVTGFFPSPPVRVVIEGPAGASINMLNENAKEWVEHVTKFVEKIEAE